MSSAPVFPYPGGVAGEEPPDPTAGAPGHFAWSRWIKQFVKNLDTQKISKLSPWSDTGTANPAFVPSKTANGYPYAKPADPIVDWPATSQALAQHLEAKIGYTHAEIVTCATDGTANLTWPVSAPDTAPAVVIATPYIVADEFLWTANVLPWPNATGCTIRLACSNTAQPKDRAVAVIAYWLP